MYFILNPIRLAMMALIAATMFIPNWWVGATLAAVMFFFSLIYYHSILRILFTLDEARLSEDKETVNDIFLSTITNITAAVALYQLTEFSYITLWCGPWLLLSFLVNIFMLLIVYEIVAINYKDDE